MTIGELARRGGVGIQTIRYYQRRGLMPVPPKRMSGFREYSEEALRALRFIRRTKGLGFSLKETARLLDVRGMRGGGDALLLEALEAKISELERKAAEIQVAIRALGQLVSRMRSTPPEARWNLFDPDAASEH